MYGHLLSYYHGENKYMDPERAVWRVSNANRTNVQFMMSVICQISAMFRDILNSDIENIKQIGVTKNNSVYTITIPIISRTAALSKIYIPGKTEKTTNTSTDIFSKSVSGLSITADEDDEKTQNIAIVPIERTLLMYRYLKEDLKILLELVIQKLDFVKSVIKSPKELNDKIKGLFINVTSANQTSKTGKKNEPEQENFEKKKKFLDGACKIIDSISQQDISTFDESIKQNFSEIKKIIVEISRTVEYFMTIENVIENKVSTPFKTSSLVVSSVWPSIPGEKGARLPISQKNAARALIEYLSSKEKSGESDSDNKSLEKKKRKQFSTAEFSNEALQVIAAVSEIEKSETRKDFINKLQTAAKREGNTSDESIQISEETANKFVKCFVEEQAFKLLQYPSIVEAFGGIWELVNVEKLKEEKSKLEECIQKLLLSMKSLSGALIQLVAKTKMNVVVPDFSLSYSAFSQSHDSSVEPFDLQPLGKEELKNLSPGLTNIGNSCYFNATMQALFATKYFHSLIDLKEVDNSMQNALAFLFRAMIPEISSSNVLDSRQYFTKIKNVLSLKKLLNEQFAMNNDKKEGENGKQEDGSELLEKILGIIDEEEARKYSSPEGIKNVSTWLVGDASKCKEQTKGKSMIENCGIEITRSSKFTEGHKHKEDCFEGNESPIIEYHPILQISLGSKTLKLDDLVKSEFFTNRRPYECKKCEQKNIEVMVTKRVTSWPKTLIIKLDRFQQFEHKRTKIQLPVQYAAKMTKGGKEYHLTAVINHKGVSLDSGHYTAIVRKKDKWYEKNDNVTFLFANSDDELEQNIEKKDKEYDKTYTQEAYVLIYETDNED